MSHMTPLLWFLRIIMVLVLVIIPTVPLAKAWRAVLRAPDGKTPGHWLLAAITVSFIWLFLGLLWAPIIGRHSTPRSYVTYANLAALGAIVFGGIFANHIARRFLIASAVAVALDWLWVLVVTAAV